MCVCVCVCVCVVIILLSALYNPLSCSLLYTSVVSSLFLSVLLSFSFSFCFFYSRFSEWGNQNVAVTFGQILHIVFWQLLDIYCCFFNVAHTWWIKTVFLPCRRRRPAPACVSHKATGGRWGGWGRILSRLQDLHKIRSELVEVMLTRRNMWNKKCITKYHVNVINDLPGSAHFDLIGLGEFLSLLIWSQIQRWRPELCQWRVYPSLA